MATYFFLSLFIIVLEVVFQIIKETSNIKGFKIFQKKFLYTSYGHDATFFVKNTESAINLFEIFKLFSQFSSLKPNKSKCEIADIGVLKGVKVALCGVRCINLYEYTVKILGIHFHTINNLKMTEISKGKLQNLRMC